MQYFIMAFLQILHSRPVNLFPQLTKQSIQIKSHEIDEVHTEALLFLSFLLSISWLENFQSYGDLEGEASIRMDYE
jgi:hypothetical protein